MYLKDGIVGYDEHCFPFRRCKYLKLSKIQKKYLNAVFIKNNTIDRNFKYSYITRGFWTLLEVDC